MSVTGWSRRLLASGRFRSATGIREEVGSLVAQERGLVVEALGSKAAVVLNLWN